MIQNINLVKQISNKEARHNVIRMFWGIIPLDGKQRNIEDVLANQGQFAKITEKLEKGIRPRK